MDDFSGPAVEKFNPPRMNAFPTKNQMKIRTILACCMLSVSPFCLANNDISVFASSPSEANDAVTALAKVGYHARISNWSDLEGPVISVQNVGPGSARIEGNAAIWVTVYYVSYVCRIGKQEPLLLFAASGLGVVTRYRPTPEAAARAKRDAQDNAAKNATIQIKSGALGDLATQCADIRAKYQQQ